MAKGLGVQFIITIPLLPREIIKLTVTISSFFRILVIRISRFNVTYPNTGKTINRAPDQQAYNHEENCNHTNCRNIVVGMRDQLQPVL
jgi:hypothetical protein